MHIMELCVLLISNMKKLLIFSSVVLLALAAFLFRPVGESAHKTYTSEKFGISFQYPKNYFLEEKNLGNAEREHVAIVLTEDTEENRNIREGNGPGRDGPVAITFDIYQNMEKLSPIMWVKGNNNSNFKLSDGSYTETTVAGVPAVSYRWDGLYRADNIVLSHNDYIISAAVTYLTHEDGIRKDFGEMLATFKTVPVTR